VSALAALEAAALQQMENSMRIFVTGATGFIGSVTILELIRAGHHVVGLARSNEASAALTKAGAKPHPGSLTDLESLKTGARDSDGVIHLGFIHDFSKWQENGRIDLAAINAMVDVLAGSDRPLVVTSGTALLAKGRLVTEADLAEKDGAGSIRGPSENATIEAASKGVRSCVIRLSPSVHGKGDHGFVPMLVKIARDKGFSGYIGEAANRWPAVHRLDAARLYRLAVENGKAGSTFHGAAEEGVAFHEIAKAIGIAAGVPTKQIAAEEAAQHFGFLGAFVGMDNPTSSELTRKTLGWAPQEIGLVDDVSANYGS
jgi:nucleoside-diphosphate-sugar epimerase